MLHKNIIMKKNLGIIIIVIGVIILAGSVILTPAHSLNLVDSDNSTHSAAAEFLLGLIIAGAGTVVLANSISDKKKV